MEGRFSGFASHRTRFCHLAPRFRFVSPIQNLWYHLELLVMRQTLVAKKRSARVTVKLLKRFEDDPVNLTATSSHTTRVCVSYKEEVACTYC